MLAFWLIARLFIAGLTAWRGGVGFGWRQGLASLSRHASASAIQVVALSLGLMAMLLLTVVRGDLLATWQNSVPSDAPTASSSTSSPNSGKPWRASCRGWASRQSCCR
jgi:putative ABC transport system permease protein